MPIIVDIDVAKRKMCSKDLAEGIGITEQNLPLLETGKVKGIRFDKLNKICKILQSISVKRVLIAPTTGEYLLSAPLTIVCQFMRLAMAVWFIWGLAESAILWSDKDKILRVFSAVAGHALEPISDFQQAAGFLAVLVGNLPVAALVILFWRLFGHYIAGRIFDQQAVSTFQAMARVAMAAYFVGLVIDHVALVIVSNGGFHFWFEPSDVWHGSMALFLVILAEVFSAGVAVTDEHRQIV
jgi:putative transcriptional regulator